VSLTRNLIRIFKHQILKTRAIDVHKHWSV